MDNYKIYIFAAITALFGFGMGIGLGSLYSKEPKQVQYTCNQEQRKQIDHRLLSCARDGRPLDQCYRQYVKIFCDEK